MSARTPYFHPHGKRTKAGETMTDTGLVPHLSWRGLSLPVAVVVNPKREGGLPEIRECERGFPMYVLPGGRAVSARELRP